MLKNLLKIKIKLLWIIAIVVILTHCITAYMFGFITEKQLNYQFQKYTSSPLIKVISHDYSRGIFSSTETVEIALNNQAINLALSVLPKHSESTLSLNKTYSLKYTTHINHGIFAGILNGSFFPTIAYAKTSIQYSSDVDDILKKFFDKDEPITITNIVYINKSGKILFNSPSFKYSEAVSGVKVTSGGMDLSVNYNQLFDKFNSNLLIPKFELIAPSKGKLVINNITYHSISSDSVNHIKVGTTNLSIDNVDVAWNESMAINVKFGDIIHMFTGINSADFLNNIDAIDPTNFSIENIKYNSQSNDDGKWFNASAMAWIDKIQSNGKVYGPMDLQLSLEHILASNFSKMLDIVESASTIVENDVNKQNLIIDLKTVMGPILVESPVIKLNKFALTIPSGSLLLNGSVSTNNFALSDMYDQESFIKKLNLNLKFSIPKPVLNYLFVLQMRYLLNAGNAKMDEKSAKALEKVVDILLDSQLKNWISSGYLIQNGDAITGNLSYIGGKISFINPSSTERSDHNVVK